MQKESVRASRPRRFLRKQQVLDRTGFKHGATLQRLEAAGLFPKRVQLSPAGGKFGPVGWDEEEIEHYQAERLASREKVA
jgi:predicted DNA-binding transcriptional regulator AlpA